ncbi:ABC transporter substrate-binding protein [Mesorhizobium sp. YR577]|uniref:ABC transporter substrate-binding protein n=1 Tax=Mesorhizobium sp. YR577 TaxID=1884373 RepID=UPI0008ED2558|nr:ABC transporter substrate-binding protein [Mesorhizobium sp. YR577]SFU19087.1 peptide/nickel transport system substrate-binding protein [Mesorhizobium sp. YR577]
MAFSLRAGLVALMMAGTALPALAETLNWARASDVQTLDPHAYNEGITHTFNHQIYEPLVARSDIGELTPVLAVSWENLKDQPSIWEFKLRDGVTFHDGTAFEADDVVFSIERAMTDTSNVRSLLSSIDRVEAVDPLTVRIHTQGVNPLLVNSMINIFMMNREWSQANNATKPQDFKAGGESFAATHENGTGAYKLVIRVPDSRTELAAYDGYWGKGEFPLDIDRIVYTPIQSPATRVAALLSGEVNFLQDVPAQDISRLEQAPGLKVVRGPENRTIFFGLNVGAEKLEFGQAKGNPFADKRVRHAMNMSIDREAIKRVVMRGESIPLGTIAPPFINGYTEEIGKVPAVDLDAAKALMAEAGYGDGFTVTLHCTNDAFINEEAICQAVVGMLGRIGIDVKLDVQPGGVQFPAIANGKTDFYIMGWGVSTFDSQYLFDNLVHSRSNGRGAWSSVNYVNPEIDAKIESLAAEPDIEKRNATIAEIWNAVQEETFYLPIHNQMLARASAEKLGITANLGNQIFVKNVTVAK